MPILTYPDLVDRVAPGDQLAIHTQSFGRLHEDIVTVREVTDASIAVDGGDYLNRSDDRIWLRPMFQGKVSAWNLSGPLSPIVHLEIL